MNQTEYPIPKSKRFLRNGTNPEFETSHCGWKHISDLLESKIPYYMIDALDCCNEAIACFDWYIWHNRIVAKVDEYVNGKAWWEKQRRRQLRRLARAEKAQGKP